MNTLLTNSSWIGEWYQNLNFSHRWREILEPRDGAVLDNYFHLFIQPTTAGVPRHLGKKFQVSSKQPRVINGGENDVSSPLL